MYIINFCAVLNEFVEFLEHEVLKKLENKNSVPSVLDLILLQQLRKKYFWHPNRFSSRNLGGDTVQNWLVKENLAKSKEFVLTPSKKDK